MIFGRHINRYYIRHLPALLLGVLSLGILGGVTIRIMADGADEQEAVDSLVAKVESGFAE